MSEFPHRMKSISGTSDCAPRSQPVRFVTHVATLHCSKKVVT